MFTFTVDSRRKNRHMYIRQDRNEGRAKMVRGQLKVKLAFKLVERISGKKWCTQSAHERKFFKCHLIRRYVFPRVCVCRCLLAPAFYVNSYYFCFGFILNRRLGEQLQPISCLPKFNAKLKESKKRALLLCTFCEPFAFRSAQTRRTNEKTNIVSKFEAVYCTILNIAHANTYTSADALNGIITRPRAHTHRQFDTRTQCDRCIHKESACNVTTTTRQRLNIESNGCTHIELALKLKTKRTLKK